MKTLKIFTIAVLGLSLNVAKANHEDLASPSTVRIKRNMAGQSQCLDIDRGSNLSGAKLLQYGCVRPSPSGFSSQDFYIEESAAGYHEIKSAKSRKCLEVRGLHLGAKVEQQSCNGTSNQQFELLAQNERTFQIRARQSGYCLGVSSGSAKDGLAVQQIKCDISNNNQIFEITESY